MLPGFRRETLVRMMRLLDLAALCTAFLAALAISSGNFTWPGLAGILIIRIALGNLLSFAGYLALCSAVFAACDFYVSHRLSHWYRRLSEILLAATVTTGVLATMSLPLQFAFATNAFLGLFWLLSLCALFLSRESVRLLLQLARLHGRNLRYVIIVGEEPAATALALHVRQGAGLGYRVLRIIDARKETTEDGRIAGDTRT